MHSSTHSSGRLWFQSTLAAAFFLCLPVPGSTDGWVHPFDYPQSENTPHEFRAVIEIPAGGFTKYEIDKETGHLRVDRFVSMPVAYPANYGSICQSLGGDDDPLDVLVLSREPIHPGAILEVRPVGVLRTVDGGEADDKILAVPTADVDPTYAPIRDIEDLAQTEKQRIAEFFRVYKRMGKKVVEVKGWGPAAEARNMLIQAFEAYAAKHAPETPEGSP